ncbi:MAG TPA: hypothetical protein DCR16_05810 [Lachnospiraceae bacterium]|nr:hypothetical protein [Lachnospiraceae bacterium]
MKIDTWNAAAGNAGGNTLRNQSDRALSRIPGRLRLLHRESGCSTMEISAILEISPRAYSYYESGQRQIGLDGVIALARFYDVSMDYICGLTDYRGEFPSY